MYRYPLKTSISDQRLGALEPAMLTSALESGEADIRKTALLIAEAEGSKSTADVSRLLGDNDARVRLLALRAMAAVPLTTEASARLLAVLPELKDDWSRSAAAAAASSNAAAVLTAALSGQGVPDAALLALAESLTGSLTADPGDGAALRAVFMAASKASVARQPLVVTIFETAARRLPALHGGGETDIEREESAALTAALDFLISSGDPVLSAAVLPAAAAWSDAGKKQEQGRGQRLEGGAAAKGGPVLAAAISHLRGLAADASQPEALRQAAVRGLIRARQADAGIVPATLALLKTNPGDALSAEIIRSFQAAGDDTLGPALAGLLPELTPGSQSALYEVLLSRAAWTAALLDAMEAKNVPVSLFGPSRLSRLRQHPAEALRARAIALIEVLGGGSNPQKDQLITALEPEISSKAGDAANGRTLFTSVCAVCHQVNGGGSDVGPVLDGIGVHGTHELLVHILDPSRMVDNEHRAWSFTLKNGGLLTGIIARENDRSVTLKLPGGIRQDVAVAEIQSRVDTGVSLMPEGFEGLGADGLRDILAFLSQGSGKYRALQLGRAFTTDTGGGLYASRGAKDNTVQPKKYGISTVEGVPFSLPDPATTPTGGNVIVLKSGIEGTYAATLPQRVEIPVGFAAGNLHFLGGVAGWGGGPDNHRPAMRVTIEHDDGKTQVEELDCGDVFIDYVSGADVPGSKRVDGLTTRAHVRYFHLPVKDTSPIRRLVLEGYANGLSPTTLAITADTGPPMSRLSGKAGEPASGK